MFGPLPAGCPLIPDTTVLMEDRLGRALAAAQTHAEPFPYFCASALFSDEVLGHLAGFSFAGEGQQIFDGRREANAERAYVDPKRRADEPLLDALATAFQSKAIAGLLGRLCGTSFAGTYLRIEYAQDREGFWLEPHQDLGVKKLTLLIALEGSRDLGTDLYEAPDFSGVPQPVKRLPFEPNGAMFFVPSDASWHGFAPRRITAERKSLIVNYVGADWRSREQLAFPDRPIAL